MEETEFLRLSFGILQGAGAGDSIGARLGYVVPEYFGYAVFSRSGVTALRCTVIWYFGAWEVGIFFAILGNSIRMWRSSLRTVEF